MTLSNILLSNREKIANTWSKHLYTTKRYKRVHSYKEILTLTGEITDAICDSLKDKKFSGINRWAEKIAKLTLEHDMKLAEVQYDCVYFLDIIVPILAREMTGTELQVALKKIISRVTYMTTRFSNFFEALHFSQIKDYTDNLEQKVRDRSRELANSEAKYRTLVEEINDGYFVNLDDKVVFANRAFCEMHGYEREELLGMHYWDLIALESMDYTRSFYHRRLAGFNVPTQYTYFRRHKDGTSFPTENKVTVITYDGKVAAAGICRDITERVAMEQRIRLTENLARIGQLTTSLAHEIRNPLSSIKMSIKLAVDGLPDNIEEKRGLQISEREIRRLENILSEMLDFARPLAISLKPVDIAGIVDRALLILKNRLEERSITVRKKYSREIPLLNLDSDKIMQAFINMFLNSIEVMDMKGRIIVTTSLTGNDVRYARVTIHDNGPGVRNQKDMLCLFDPFFTKKKQDGTGLGLYNVKRIIEAHKGQVTAANVKNGFSISILLPVDSSREKEKP